MVNYKKIMALVLAGVITFSTGTAGISLDAQAAENSTISDVFTDVSENSWYAEYVKFVYEKGLMTGYDGEFSPEGTMTRAMLVETLYRIEGSPAVTDYTKYHELVDVKDDDWWAASVAWALNAGVATGDIVAKKFNPTSSVTREEIATFLYRYVQLKGKDVSLSKPADEILGNANVSSWAKEAFAWTVDKNMIKGLLETDANGNTVYNLLPQGKAIRAQLATILTRYTEEVEGNEPTKDDVIPDANQYRYQKEELAAFCHFGPNTFNEIEWGEHYGDREPSDIFSLTENFDAEKMISTLKDAGFEKIIVTAKHHDGFCIWNSEYTDYSVKNTTYAEKNYDDMGGDILAEISAACTEYDMDMGLYLSPWDIHEPSYGYYDENGNPTTKENDVKDYNDYYNNQLEEILGSDKYGNNGHFTEVWMDGAKGSGANAQEYDFVRWFNTIQKYEGKAAGYDADCMLFGAQAYTTVRWIGNESGFANTTTWSKSTVNKANNTIDSNTQGYTTMGFENGNQWTVPEVDARITDGWFWGTQKCTPKTIADLGNMYFNSVGRNSVLLLNVPPNNQGTVDQAILDRVTEFGKNIKETFAENLAKNATITASEVRLNDEAYSPSNVVDGNDESYWTTNDGTTEGTLTMKFDTPQVFDVVSIEESIEFGQRITSFKVEYRNGEAGEWKTFATGTTIGGKRLCRSFAVKADQVRITVSTASTVIKEPNVPMLNEVGLYKASEGFAASNGAPAGIDVIDERDSAFTFKGRWEDGSGSAFVINGTEKWANAGNSFTVEFTGSKIYLIGTKDDPNHGKANVSIDDGAATEINTNGTSRKTGQIIYESGDLTDGKHTLTLTATGTIGIDGAYVINNGGLGMVGIEKNAYTMNEDSTMDVKLVRVGGAGKEVTVTLTPNPGSAIQDDFNTELIQTVTFAAGETEKTVQVQTRRNTNATGDRQFTVELSSAADDLILGFNKKATVTIKDTEAEPERSDNYSAEDPFVFPSEVDASATMEAEFATEVNNSSDSDSDPNWPFAVATGNWASGGKFLNCMAFKDTAKFAYTAAKAGTYEVTVTYRSGSNDNKIAWSEEGGKITAGQVTAGAADGAKNTHTATFELVITEAGAGTLVITAPDTGKGPQIDKFDIVLKTIAE